MSESIFRIGKMGYPVVPVTEKQRHSDTGIYCVVYDEEKDYGSPFLVLNSRSTSLPGAFDIASVVYFASRQGGYVANTLKDALYRAMTREKAYFGERDIYKENPNDPSFVLENGLRGRYIAYEIGQLDFVSLIDNYRIFVGKTKED